MEIRQFKKGEIIFKEFTLGSSMYEIRSGTVGIYVAHGTDDERKLTELEAGRIFGEMSVIEVVPRSATAVALTDVEAKEVTTADLQVYFAAKPERILDIMRNLSHRLRELTGDYQEVCGLIGEWERATAQHSEKSSGLMNALKKFASLFEGMKYVNYTYMDPYYFGYY